ncbi:MAG: SCO6880 family protein [Acidimicrobiia bacterium]
MSGYKIGPVQRRTVIAGLRTYQVAAIGVGVLLLMVSLGNVVMLALMVPVAGVIAASGFFPVGGRTVDEWFPSLLSYARRGFGRNKRFVAGSSVLGTVEKGARSVPPPPLRGVRILRVGTSYGEVGILRDDTANTWTGVLSARGQSFALTDPDEQAQRLSSWANILSSFARESTPVFRVQWIERAFPEDSDAIDTYTRENIALPSNHPLAAAYLELVEAAGPIATSHEIYIAVTVADAKSHRQIKQAGGGDMGACELVMRELASMENQLVSANVVSNGMLNARQIARVVRSAFDPSDVRRLGARAAGDPSAAGTSTRNSWPMATENNWGYYKTDGAYHATFWVAEWPRIETSGDFLAPLLLQTDSARTVSVVMEPVAPSKAIREVETAHTSFLADEEIRQRGGYNSSARRARQYESLVQRESELADGHGMFRFSGYVTVSANSLEELDSRIEMVEQGAHMSRLDIRRLWGEQDSAFCFSLPLGRGLK